jgi:hypothetical protein
MIKKIKYLLSVLILCQVFSCQDEENLVVIAPEVLPYFKRFEAEATKRGKSFTVATTDISAAMIDISDINVIAQCKHNGDKDPIINVDSKFWATSSDLQKEFYIFHELGHCFLKRSHLDTKTSSGSCNSIMHSSNTVCSFIYNTSTRAAYLDELFDHQ